MSLKGASKLRTLCEVLREINDELIGTEYHAAIFPKLIEAERMAKKMTKKLRSYSRKYDAGWWEANPDYERDLERRLNTEYVRKEQ